MDPDAGPGRRLVAAVVAGLGVALLTAGLLTWTEPVEAGPPGSAFASEPPTSGPGSSVPEPSFGGLLPPPTFPPDRVATRVIIPALRIDLPVVLQPDSDGYPWCDVAMYLRTFGQPGSGRATYLYAHARAGMFLKLLAQSRISDGAKMLGMLVEVYTNDERHFIYQISQVLRHSTSLEAALAAGESLWLQTSEGPTGTVPKLQVVATLLSEEAADPDEAHPDARPRECRTV